MKSESFESKPNTSKTAQTEEVPSTNYNFDDSVENDLILKYQPTFLAKGGEHLVYEIPGHPNVVVKIRVNAVKKMLESNYQAGQPLDSLSPEDQSKGQVYLEIQRGRYQAMRQHFGAEHVPNQKEILIKVPISEDIIRSFYDGKLPVTTNEVWGVAMIQRRIKELNGPHLTMVSGYSEQGELSPEVYSRVTQHLIQGKELETPLNNADFLAVQSEQGLRTLFEESMADENLKETLVDLVDKIISYTAETGEILDLAGGDNIIIHKKEDGRWSYTLVDARYPGTANMIEEVKMVLLKLATGDELKEDEKNMLLNTLNFARTVNGLAEQVGVVNRINIIPDGLHNTDFDFLKLLS